MAKKSKKILETEKYLKIKVAEMLHNIANNLEDEVYNGLKK